MRSEQVGSTTAIASLPGVGPARLTALLASDEPDAVWNRIRSGTIHDDPTVARALGERAHSLSVRWREAARSIEPADVAARHRELGFRLLDSADPDYPTAFRGDVEPPRLLWVAGDITRLRPHTVAVVGTRRCTRYGHDVARRFGSELAAAGVSVISGLALGVDAAAHAGALDAGEAAAGPVGVVGTGLDVIYPRRNRALWRSVVERGMLLSEAPPGASAEPWRFPARNRLIAALADVVVVVESSERGGSMYTVDEAMTRDVEVRAVPGPITSPVSAGTNRLLADGAAPALSGTELLESLGIPAARPAGGSGPIVHRDPQERAVLDVLAAGPVTFDELAERTCLDLGRLGLVTARLQVEGSLTRSGGWYQRTG